MKEERERERDQKQVDFPQRGGDARYRGRQRGGEIRRRGEKAHRALHGSLMGGGGNISLEVEK